MTNQDVKLAVACGGTGGHFYPGVAIAKEFQAQGGKVVLFIGGHHVDEHLAAARKQGLDAIPAPTIRLPRGPIQMVLFPFRMLSCIVKTGKLLKQHKVRLALGMGSYASVPLGLGARFVGVTLALHEGNAGMGQANRLLSRFAKVLGLSFPLRHEVSTRAEQAIVGMPIRQPIVDAAEQDAAGVKSELCAELDLDANRKLVFVFGGSQGSPAINQAVQDLQTLLSGEQKGSLQFIHFTGRDENAELVKAYSEAGVKAVVRPRDPGIERYYLASDYVICRAGASTISELAVLGKAPLMIPYPGAKENHQMANALTVMDHNGGWVIDQKDLTPEGLLERVSDWLTKGDDRSEGIRKLARPNATKEMVTLLWKAVGQKRDQS